MTKLAKKISAAVMAGVVTVCAAVSVSAATTATCPPHNLIRDAGTKIYSYSWSHPFTVTNANGTEFTEKCTETENRYRYNYKCTRCDYVETKVTVEFVHNNPRCPDR